MQPSSKKARRINLIPFFIGALLLIGVFIFYEWYSSNRVYNELRADGVVTVAKVYSVVFTRYFSLGQYGGHVVDVSDPKQAEDLDLLVSYQVGGQNYLEKIDSTFSLANNDHVQVYRDALGGAVSIRYLKSNPAVARPEAEFTDPKNNPYFGGK